MSKTASPVSASVTRAPAATNNVPVQRSTVSGRVAWRQQGADADPTAPPEYVNVPGRRVYAPGRMDQGKSFVNMQKAKNIMRCSLGHDARINENLTMGVPIAVLPRSLRKGGGY